MTKEQKQQLWDDIAHSLSLWGETPKAEAFTTSMTKPLLDKLEMYSVARKVCNVIRCKPGEKPKFKPVPNKDLWLLPGLGYVAQAYTPNKVPAEFLIPSFAVQASNQWSLKAEIEVIESKMDRAAKALASYETEALLRTIIPPATTNPFINCIDKKQPEAGEYMLQCMRFAFEKKDKELGYILAPAVPDPDLMFIDFDSAMYSLPELGREGIWNINGEKSDINNFLVENGEYNNYTLTHPNLNNYQEDSPASVRGEYQIYGLSKDIAEHLIMLIVQEYQCFDDPTLLRRKQFGFFGWERMGFALRDPDCVVMAVINEP